MAVPTTRETFIDYVKRRLGHPVTEINVDDLQMEDRIDDALRFWQEYHFDGTEKLLVSHEVTSTDISNKYLDLGTTLNDSIIGISRMLATSGQTTNMFSVRYQIVVASFSLFWRGGAAASIVRNASSGLV